MKVRRLREPSRDADFGNEAETQRAPQKSMGHSLSRPGIPFHGMESQPPLRGTMNTRILIHHDGALGDVLLSAPCFRAIGASGGSLHLAARPDIALFLQDAGCVDSVMSAESRIFASLYAGSREHAADLSRYRRCFLFTADPRHGLRGPLAEAVGDLRLIATMPSSGMGEHVAAFRLRQITDAPDLLTPPFLAAPAGRRRHVREWLSSRGGDRASVLVALHPGSGGREKCWPLDRYCELIRRLSADDRMFILLAGPAEGPELRRNMKAFAASWPRVLVLEDAELSFVAALLAQCSHFAGNDSGLSHLAASLGIPTTVLFGPTDPSLWKPAGEKVVVLRGPFPERSMLGISVEQAFCAIKPALVQGAAAAVSL